MKFCLDLFTAHKGLELKKGNIKGKPLKTPQRDFLVTEKSLL
jgi:hypothetical protein